MNTYKMKKKDCRNSSKIQFSNKANSIHLAHTY